MTKIIKNMSAQHFLGNFKTPTSNYRAPLSIPSTWTSAWPGEVPIAQVMSNPCYTWTHRAKTSKRKHDSQSRGKSGAQLSEVALVEMSSGKKVSCHSSLWQGKARAGWGPNLFFPFIPPTATAAFLPAKSSGVLFWAFCISLFNLFIKGW